MSTNTKMTARTPPALPAATAEPPSAAAYRLRPENINMSTCRARWFTDEFNDSGAIYQDRRWTPIIYRESQCGAKVLAGSDLCLVCTRRMEKMATLTAAGVITSKAIKQAHWNGRVTEEPPSWCHMLGTAWAEKKKPVWKGTAAAADDDDDLRLIGGQIYVVRGRDVFSYDDMTAGACVGHLSDDGESIIPLPAAIGGGGAPEPPASEEATLRVRLAYAEEGLARAAQKEAALRARLAEMEARAERAEAKLAAVRTAAGNP